LDPGIAEELYVNEVMQLLTFGPARMSKDGTGVSSASFESLEEGETSETREEMVARCKDSRDHFTRSMVLSFVRGGPLGLAEKVFTICTAEAMKS
jgi:hypothetical protein